MSQSSEKCHVLFEWPLTVATKEKQEAIDPRLSTETFSDQFISNFTNKLFVVRKFIKSQIFKNNL